MKASKASVKQAQNMAEIAKRLGEVELKLGEVELKLDQLLAVMAAKKAPAKVKEKEGGSNAKQTTG